jgi:hypothetical protein
MTESGNNGARPWSWRGRRVAISLNTAATLGLALALAAMLNYLGYRHFARADWSRSRYYSLSDKTRLLLGGLTNPVDVVVFFQPDHDLYEDVDNLLREYAYACDRIRVERVDPDRDLARTEALLRKYAVGEANVVVFDSGGRTKYVKAQDIAEYDYTPITLGGLPEKISFKGEQAFSSAIQGVTQGRVPAVCFLRGHGERDIEDFNRSGGYSDIAEYIRRDVMDVRTMALSETKAIPDDCDALVIAGAQKRLSDAEVSLVRSYLERQGRLMVLLDADTRCGLEPLLADWGVRMADDVVVDASRTLSGRELFITQYEPHPITAPLRGVASVFYLPRSVEPALPQGEAADPADRPHAVPLASSSDAGWADTDLDENPMKYDLEADRPGPIPVAAAVEKGPVPGIDVQIRPTRLVVFGDSDFVANGAMTGGNPDFFLNALNWLLEREQLISIAPKPADTLRLVMSRAQLSMLFWLVVVILPAQAVVIGGLVWLRRRA